MAEAARWLTAVERVAPVVREHADEADHLKRTPTAVVEAFVAEGLFKLWVPRSFGGAELALPAALRVFEATSRIDGSAGWAATIGTGGGLFAAVMEPAAAREVFAPADAVIAGSGSPTGTADVTNDGYRARGRWKYASGAHHATSFTANCTIVRDGAPVIAADGEPAIRAMTFPRQAVELFDTWDVSGMRGTGSVDFAVAAWHVPAEMTFSVFDDLPREPGPLYRVPFMTSAEASFGAVALGVAGGAIDAFSKLARDKPSRGGGVLGDTALARINAAEAVIAVESARLAFYAATQEAWSAATGSRPQTDRKTSMVRLAAIHAGRTGAHAATQLFQAAGMSPLSQASTLGRAWRDAHAVAQHMLLSPAGIESAGAVLLAGTPA